MTMTTMSSTMAAGLVGSEILKIAADIREMVREGVEVCNLTVGDFDPRQFPIPASLSRGIQDALAAGHTNWTLQNIDANGWDAQGHRLGYGGGFFDRTLAAMKTRPLVIGVAYELARIATIHPQAWDIPVDYIVSERGVYRRDAGELVFLGNYFRNSR